jgi:molecular chaperone GrpE
VIGKDNQRKRPAGAPDEELRPAGAPAERREAAGTPDRHVEDRPDEPETSMHGAKVADSATNAPIEAEGAALESDFDALVADVKRERDEYLELAKRARADFDNYRKRATRESEEAERRGKATLARELVPALDNLERALRSAGVDPEAGGLTGDAGEPMSEEVSAREALARGVALVYGELRAALERAGVESYDPTGERFDPAVCEALATRPGEDGVEPGTVVETLEKGYRLDGLVLRAARVVVSE